MLRVPLTTLVVFALATQVAHAGKGGNREVTDAPAWMTNGTEVRLDIVQALIEQGETSSALEIIRVMRTEGIKSPELDLMQGIVLRNQGLTVEAEDLLRSARKHMPGDSRPSDALCVLYADSKRMDDAIDACARATRGNDVPAKSWNNYGFLLLAVDRAEDARDALRQAVASDGAEPKYRNNLAFAQIATGQTEQALRTFQTTSTKADALYNVGTGLERFGDPEQALKYYRRALEQDPQHHQARDAAERLDAAESLQETP